MHAIPTDEQLLRRFGKGDDAAFEALVRRHGPALKGYALRMLRNPELAEEIFEETFLRVARERGRWEQKGTVRAWLFTIAHHLCIDQIRRQRVADSVVTHLYDHELFRGPEPSPEARAVLGQRAEQLEAALAELAPEHREVLLLRSVHGLSAEETAQALGTTPDRVHSAVSYARRRLRDRLGDDEADDAPVRRRMP